MEASVDTANLIHSNHRYFVNLKSRVKQTGTDNKKKVIEMNEFISILTLDLSY